MGCSLRGFPTRNQLAYLPALKDRMDMREGRRVSISALWDAHLTSPRLVTLALSARTQCSRLYTHQFNYGSLCSISLFATTVCTSGVRRNAVVRRLPPRI